MKHAVAGPSRRATTRDLAPSAAHSLAFSVSQRPVPRPFFRDASGLKSLQRQARLRLEADPGKPLRVWVPQCAGGEDAYSVAISLLEACGARWREVSLCVFATDSDEDALARARAGLYPAAGRGAGRARLGRFFVQEAHRIRVGPIVRSACRFTTHRISDAPPFSRVDLIVCRDTLAGLPPAQRRGALQFFRAALAPGGVLLDRSGAAAEEPLLFVPAGRGGIFVSRSRAEGDAGGASRNPPLVNARQRESEDRFRMLFSRAEDPILVRDARTDVILRANEAAQRLYGWSLQELLRMREKDLLAGPDSVRRPQDERRSEDRLRLPHYRRKNGTLFPADVSTSFLMLEGRPCRLSLVRDATQRLRTSAGRVEKDRESFAGDVVHELRSPLAVIRGSVESLRKGVKGTRARSEFLTFIENHAARMARMVDQLLNLNEADSKKRKTRSSAVALSESVWEIASSFIPIAERRGISIKIDIPQDLTVRIDPADLPHIFGNLLDNAIKFTPRGGKVTVHARAEGREALVSVSDTGPGIAPQDLPRVFERFFRGERTRNTKGTGLGLAIVQGILKVNHGRVFVENGAQGGAVFHVALPLAEETTR